MAEKKSGHTADKEQRCLCGGHRQFIEGTVNFNLGGKTATIHNVPYYICDNCEEKSFDSSVNLVNISKRHIYKE